jgi:hypothetical protein
MLVSVITRDGERVSVEFAGLADEEGRTKTIHSWSTEECRQGEGPHEARIPIPSDAPLGEYYLTRLSLLRGDVAEVTYSEDLDDVWLTVGKSDGPLTNAVLRLTRSE